MNLRPTRVTAAMSPQVRERAQLGGLQFTGRLLVAYAVLSGILSLGGDRWLAEITIYALPWFVLGMTATGIHNRLQKEHLARSGTELEQNAAGTAEPRTRGRAYRTFIVSVYIGFSLSVIAWAIASSAWPHTARHADEMLRASFPLIFAASAWCGYRQHRATGPAPLSGDRSSGVLRP